MESNDDSSTESSPVPEYINDVSNPTTTEEIKAPATPPHPDDGEKYHATTIHARAYQLEMFEESLKHNIIVAMDTGSGKTQVAVLRIQAELARSRPGMIIWFLATTVALCSQQFRVLSSQITGVQIKMLSGSDNVDTWSDVSTWDRFLKNTSVVVSTHQVLLDALSHKFVQMSALSLIVFDEAHNCVGKHPGSKIMGLYKEDKEVGLPIPSILGLTASPIMRSSVKALDEIENTMDAMCRTPSKHREELLSHVKPPSLCRVLYGPNLDPKDRGINTKSMESLEVCLRNLDIYQDPYVLRKMADNTERGQIELENAVMKKDTYIFNQMRSLYRKSKMLRCELGAWAADYFISASITQYLDSINTNNTSYAAWDLAEKAYLAATLRKVELFQPSIHDDLQITGKVEKLIEVLLSSQESALGIIFVKETATVNVLRKLLSVHPLTRDRFRIGSMVGTSRYPARKRDVGELNQDDGTANLESFRSSKLDVLIATSVLEEGIDVPACNLVICFDKPANLKSFIQRRGRARMRESRLVLLFDTDSDYHTQWQALEQDMKKKYEDEERERQDVDQPENTEEDPIDPFYTRGAHAKLDFDAAKQHLEHFCSLSSTRQFVDCSPYYIIQKTTYTHSKSEPPLIKATVVLPNSLSPGLRRIQSAKAWYSEKNACKDAAFQAYVQLYEAGLVNEYLMPLRDDELVPGLEPRAPEVEVSERWNPWTHVADAWSGPQRYRRLIRISEDNPEQETVLCNAEVVLPVPIPDIPQFNVYWGETPWNVKLDDESIETVVGESQDAHQTMALITLAYSHRFNVKEGGQHVVRFNSTQDHISTDHIGSDSFTLELAAQFEHKLPYLVRTPVNNGLYFYESWLPSRPSLNLVQRFSDYYLEDHPTDVPWLALRKWPKRQDFLHPVYKEPGSMPSKKQYHTVWPTSFCRVDSTPIINVQFGSLIPSITHIIEIYLVAHELSSKILDVLNFHDLGFVVTAISASSAREATDYQRYEFLGDSILKVLATISVAVNYPNYTEEYLSKRRVGLVSNAALCRSALEKGLDRFILTKPFTGAKWQPIYVDDLLSTQAEPGRRMMSTKVLADVVEALIGASFMEGGMDMALKCIALLVPNINWYGEEAGRLALSSMRPSTTELPASLVPLENLIGHTFANKSLLVEAVTHTSYIAGSSTDASFERLEFLGDAILDGIIMPKLWESDRPHKTMTLLRAACVNADLLGFLGMEWTILQESAEVVDGTLISSQVHFPFWSFMRHSSPAISIEQEATKQRHLEQRDAILDAIQHSSIYPWALLAHLDIRKFYSDIFESVLAAVWVDSGSMEVCERLLERIGILPYLRRILADNVDVTHPKSKLGELVGARTLRYEVSREEAPTAYLTCKVFVADEFIVEVGGGIHKDQVITEAAEAACKKLNGAVMDLD